MKTNLWRRVWCWLTTGGMHDVHFHYSGADAEMTACRRCGCVRFIYLTARRTA